MTRLVLLLRLVLLGGPGACKNGSSKLDIAKLPIMSNKLRIRIGSESFTASLFDNPSAATFVAQLPLTVAMSELNGNEKYIDLAASLATNAATPARFRQAS